MMRFDLTLYAATAVHRPYWRETIQSPARLLWTRYGEPGESTKVERVSEARFPQYARFGHLGGYPRLLVSITDCLALENVQPLYIPQPRDAGTHVATRDILWI